MSIERMTMLYEKFISAMYSENLDYILKQLSIIYTELASDIVGKEIEKEFLIPYSHINDYKKSIEKA